MAVPICASSEEDGVEGRKDLPVACADVDYTGSCLFAPVAFWFETSRFLSQRNYSYHGIKEILTPPF